MKENNKSGNLLQTIQRRIGCIYLSDLHTDIYKEAIAGAAKELLKQKYSLEEWNEAVSYITSAVCSCDSAEDAYMQLLKYKNE